MGTSSSATARRDAAHPQPLPQAGGGPEPRTPTLLPCHPQSVLATALRALSTGHQSLKNRLYYGDNLDILRRTAKGEIASESVDLYYIDPPFNSKRNQFQIYNNQGGEDRAQAQAFVDTWEWGDEAADGLEWITERLNSGKLTPQTLALIRRLEHVFGIVGRSFEMTNGRCWRIFEGERTFRTRPRCGRLAHFSRIASPLA